MKKIALILNLFGVAALTVLPSCKKEDPTPPHYDIETILLTPTKQTIKVGDTFSPTVTLTPDGAVKSDIVWSSENERVATVNADGVITGVGYGVTNIYAISGAVNASIKISVQKPERTYTLAWSDEFDGTAVDLSKWKFQIGPNANNEKQYYKKENAKVENGHLIITGKKEDTQYGQTTFHYTSSRLHSIYSQTYGKIEARICWGEGKGTWPAFWMMPSESKYGSWPRSGEIDIVEHVGSQPKLVSNAVHTKLKNGTGKPSGNWGVKSYKDNIETEFHKYGIEWIENYYNGCGAIIFYFDDTVTATYMQNTYATSTWEDWPFNQNFYAILNLALGGNWGGEIDDSALPTQMKVDWVRFYTQN